MSKENSTTFYYKDSQNKRLEEFLREKVFVLKDLSPESLFEIGGGTRCFTTADINFKNISFLDEGGSMEIYFEILKRGNSFLPHSLKTPKDNQNQIGSVLQGIYGKRAGLKDIFYLKGSSPPEWGVGNEKLIKYGWTAIFG